MFHLKLRNSYRSTTLYQKQSKGYFIQNTPQYIFTIYNPGIAASVQIHMTQEARPNETHQPNHHGF